MTFKGIGMNGYGNQIAQLFSKGFYEYDAGMTTGEQLIDWCPFQQFLTHITAANLSIRAFSQQFSKLKSCQATGFFFTFSNWWKDALNIDDYQTVQNLVSGSYHTMPLAKVHYIA